LLEVNQKLKESEALKSNFLSNARNEVINPVTSILSLAQSIALSNTNDQNQNKRLAEIIYREAFDLNFQMNNIFSSAEIEAGEAFCEMSSLDLNQIIDEEISKFKELAHDKGLRIVFGNKLDTNNNTLITDRSKLKLILANLIVNAINWADKTGDIIIDLTRTKKMINLSVSDPGSGIHPDHHKIIFDRFKTIDPTVHTENKGHGLGLTIVKAYAEMLGGEVILKSKKGKGSTFTILLPKTPIQENMHQPFDNADDVLFSDGELF
jgi:signal transduction histidine kinase